MLCSNNYAPDAYAAAPPNSEASVEVAATADRKAPQTHTDHLPICSSVTECSFPENMATWQLQAARMTDNRYTCLCLAQQLLVN